MTDVRETFRQHEILLTGANGFLGKVVLGLLLDRLPEFRRLHILIRPGRNLSARERFYEETLGSPSLSPTVDAIAEKRGKDFLRGKITVWSGDISQPHLGIEPHKLDPLVGRIGAIINCAGRVDFFPPVDDSFSANVDGVEHAIAVSKRLSAKLVHVSTCYVCGEGDGLVEEAEPILGFYPRRKGREDLAFRHTEELRYCRERIRQIYEAAGLSGRPVGADSPPRSKEVAQRLVALGKQRAEHWGWVNTYTYAKSLGEQLIAAQPRLDYAIVRPAIVESALRFPFPGWIEGGRTAAPLVLMALGGMKEWPMRRDAPLEVVPVDLVGAAILAITALLLDGRLPHRVCQLGTADVNPVHLGRIVTLVDSEARRLQRSGRGSARSPLVHRLVRGRSARRRAPVKFVSAEEARLRRARLQRRIERAHAFIDAARKLLKTTGIPGERTLTAWARTLRTLGLQASFREQTLDQYLPFVLHNRYIFESENIRAAYARLSERDRELLPWNPEQIDWQHYWIHNQIRGIERWVQPEAVREWMFKM